MTLYKSKHRVMHLAVFRYARGRHEVFRSGWMFRKHEKDWELTYWFLKWAIVLEHLRYE